MCARDGHINYEIQDLNNYSIEAVSMTRELSLLLVISLEYYIDGSSNLLLHGSNLLIRASNLLLRTSNLLFKGTCLHLSQSSKSTCF